MVGKQFATANSIVSFYQYARKGHLSICNVNHGLFCQLRLAEFDDTSWTILGKKEIKHGGSQSHARGRRRKRGKRGGLLVTSRQHLICLALPKSILSKCAVSLQ